VFECDIDCNDNGDCSSGISGDGSCICDMGWWGANCEKCCDSTSQDLDSCDARYYGATADGIPTSCTQCPDIPSSQSP
jgi:hypothetical protein